MDACVPAWSLLAAAVGGGTVGALVLLLLQALSRRHGASKQAPQSPSTMRSPSVSKQAAAPVVHLQKSTGSWTMGQLKSEEEFPTTEWALPEDDATHSQHKQHVAFLSHYKHEAGTEARAMKTYFQQMLPTHPEPCYLDSDNLSDLTKLFREGVRRSETLVVLATAHTFSRPWCLAEIYVAAQLKLPVLLVTVDGGGFEAERVRAMLSIGTDDAFKALLEDENPGAHEALAHILRHFKVITPAQPDAEFRQSLLEALGWAGDEAGSPSSAPHRLRFSPNSSTNAIQADLIDLLRVLAERAGQGELAWTGSGAELAASQRRSRGAETDIEEPMSPRRSDATRMSDRRSSSQAVLDCSFSTRASKGRGDISLPADAAATGHEPRPSGRAAIKAVALAPADGPPTSGRRTSLSVVFGNRRSSTANITSLATAAGIHSPGRLARSRLQASKKWVSSPQLSARLPATLPTPGRLIQRARAWTTAGEGLGGKAFVDLGSVTLADPSRFLDDATLFVAHQGTKKSIKAAGALQTALQKHRSGVRVLIDGIEGQAVSSMRDDECDEQSVAFERNSTYEPSTAPVHSLYPRSFPQLSPSPRLALPRGRYEPRQDLSSSVGVIRAAQAVVLLLTEHVLAEPRVLLQLFTARSAGLPIIPVEMEDGGYVFEQNDKRAHSRQLTALPPTASRPHSPAHTPPPTASSGRLSRPPPSRAFVPTLLFPCAALQAL